MKSGARYLIIVVAICSWLAISNHCAFAALMAHDSGCQPASHYRQDADTTECPFHSKPGKSKGQPLTQQCCKILRAVILAKTKNWARDDTNFFDVDLFFEWYARLACSRRAPVALPLDTGPPGARSFAELILQQSLLAHAPPFLA